MGANMDIARGPDLNDVVSFVDVVRASSFSVAAAAKGVPVSTVSRRVARLERALGARLLERTTRHVRLTDVGQTYFAHAERAIDELTEGGQRVGDLQVAPRGRVRLTAPVGQGPRLATALASFMQKAPLVAVEVDLTDRRVDLVAAGVDIALRGGPIDTGDFVAKRLFVSTRRLFASRDYLKRRGLPTSLAELESHDLIATRGSTNGSVWELYEVGGGEPRPGRRRSFRFMPRIVVNELISAKHAALAGGGITLLPSPDVDQGELEIVLPNVSGAQGGLWLMYPSHRALRTAVRACVDHLVRTLPTTNVDGERSVPPRTGRRRVQV